MSDRAPSAQPKSEIDRVRGITFGKREHEYTPSQYHAIKSLEQERKETQEEISKLTLIIEDATIEMSDDEIFEVNDQINRLLEKKREAEIEIRKVSEGKINYGSFAGPSTLFKYFGRAKDLKQKMDEAQKSEKRKVFEFTHVVGTDKAQLVRESLEEKPARTEAKKTRFDDDDSD